MKTCLAWLLLALAGCGNSSNVNSAGGQCKLTESPNRCVRCWAEKCPTQLDRCYGEGFHRGELISGNDNNASCRDYSICIQACGCLDGCFESCRPQSQPVCNNCQDMIFLPCRLEKCAAECGATDGGS